MSRLTADTTQIKAVAGSALSQAARNLIMLIGALIMMFVSSPKLSLLVLIAIPIIVLPLVGFGRLVRRLSRQAQDTLGDASAYAAENLAAHRTMQAYVNEKTVSDRFGRAVERAFDAARQRMRARAALTGIAIFLTVASVTGVLWYGASAVISGDMTGGRLGQFVLYALFAAGALAELSEVWGEISQAAGAAERLVRDDGDGAGNPFARKPSCASCNPQSAPSLSRTSHSLIPPGRTQKALDAVSFRVSAGETIALVGASGAGKSTIFNLLLRFYDPSAGIVRVDGVNVAEADLAALRRRIAVVPQDVALFADTVAENIRYGTPGATLSEVRRAATAAQADEFIRALPDGYNCKLGERGATLVGRTAPAHRDRARHSEERTDPAARRGDECARCRKRRRGAARARRSDGGAHDARHRASPGDRAKGRPHSGDGQGPHRRSRHARRTRAPWRHLRAPCRTAVRPRSGGIGTAGRVDPATKPVVIPGEPSCETRDPVTSAMDA